MARSGKYLWNYNRLNLWFGLGSLVLLACIVGMVADDTVREWKKYQRQFNRLEVKKTRESLKEARQALDKEKLAEIKKQAAAVEKELQSRKGDLRALNRKLKRAAAAIYRYNQQYQFAKSRFDAAKYRYEEALNHGDKAEAEAEKKELEREGHLMAKWKEKVESLEIEKGRLAAEIKGFTEKRDALQKEWDELLKQQTRLEKRLEAIEPGFRNWLLNLPLFDFIAPTIKIRQVVVEEIKDEYHFTKVPKVDRCMTCHLGIDKKGWENEAQPFRSHPRLDLFVSSTSPHPVEKFGCTVCHNGLGQATTFFRTAHTPRDAEQKEQWVKKYGWKEMKYVEEKMTPMPLIEASCFQCHNQGGVVNIPEAPKLSKGKELFEDRGCTGCHAVKGFENFRKAGPDLTHFAAKTDPEWTFKWIKDPKAYNPTTKMPKFYDLTNTRSPEDQAANNVEIDGIVEYLFKNSKEFQTAELPEGGDAENGKKLLDTVGCLGCHSVGDWKGTDFGPELNAAGSKLNPDWLFGWLKNPKHTWAETRMPDMRLSDEEARDIATYLMTLKNEKFDAMSKPILSDEALDKTALEYLASKHGLVAAKAKLAAMSKEEKKLFVGERAINRYGCFGCHTVPGFEKAGKIGVELTEEGSKDAHSFVFGFTHIPHTRHDWFFQKMKDPRIFDEGKVLTREEKLRMPEFGFTDEEAEALTVFLMSLKKSDVPEHLTKRLSEKEKAIEEGRRMVRDFNCQGCHSVENAGGTIAQTLEQGMNPPPLNGEGEKVWGDWLHKFLKEPTPIRPWLKTRMPTFGFTDDQANAFVRYFEELDNQKFSYKAKEIPKPTQEQWENGKMLYEKLNCALCHKSEPGPGQSYADLAPDLALARERLKPRWIIKWMVDPQKLYPGTRMPGFFPDLQSPLPDVMGGDAKEQIKALRDYVVNYSVEEYHLKAGSKTSPAAAAPEKPAPAAIPAPANNRANSRTK